MTGKEGMGTSGAMDLQVEKQWQENQYSRQSPAATDPRVVARYLNPRHRAPIFRREFLFECLLPVEDLEILEIGCGDGAISCLLARAGARITGVDISEHAIKLARERAKLDGVTDRCEFVSIAVQLLRLNGRLFDLVLGDSVLHHIIPNLSETLTTLRFALRPGGRAVFVEPLNLYSPLRRLRLRFPVSVNGSPGERPLEKAEIEVIHGAFPRVAINYFSMLERLSRFLPGDSYEEAGPLRRTFLYSLCAVDWLALQKLGLLHRFASYAVIQCWV